jgi:diguanylate cyclase (GGDEF)-like protein
VWLRGPQLSTKLYATIALFLAVVCVLAMATLGFASRTEEAVDRLRREVLGDAALTGRLQVLLEQHRRLVAMAAPAEGNAQEAKVYRDLNATIAGIIDRIAPQKGDSLPARFALLASQGAAVLDLAGGGQRDRAAAAAARYAAAADGLALEVMSRGHARVRAADGALHALAADARSLIGWVWAAVAATGLLIGPAGLLLLRRMLRRLQGIGTALIRLARNDTSVEIAGLGDEDEFGQLARSVSVFKAKSIELLGKKADVERLNFQLDAAINNMPLGLSMFDANDRLLVCNRRYAEMYEVPGELTRPGTAHCALWEQRTKKGARHSETREGGLARDRLSPSMLIEFAGGRTISVSRQPLRGGGWVSLHEDITERRRQEARITHLARHDPLTGLANRVLFREQLEQSLQHLVRGQGFAVLCLDLDHFKAVNDTLGHPIGDALLKQVGQRLLACVRHGDLVARLGGDEFAIIHAAVRDVGRTESLAARIVETVSAPYELDGHSIDIGTSIGVTLAPRDGADADLLMKNADLALYRAKAAGRRGYAFFKPEMNDEVLSRRSLEADLRQALEAEALELAYQPLACLATGRVAGVDSLLRWQHPERGAIPSAEFMAVAEEAGLAADIGDWAIRQACVHAARWPAPVKVAVKVCAAQLVRRNVMDTVLQALAQSGLPPQRLELEMTESLLLQENANTLAMLHQLRQLGVRIAVGGFGAGYSSLANLRSFPFDKIKIDKAFIADIDRRDDARAIVQAAVTLGAGLGMTTAAEGVETFEQLALLRGWGCGQAQGYLLSPPLAAAEVEGIVGQTLAPLRDGAAAVSRESGGSGAPPRSWRAA